MILTPLLSFCHYINQKQDGDDHVFSYLEDRWRLNLRMQQPAGHAAGFA
jgi:hypothetical protein